MFEINGSYETSFFQVYILSVYISHVTGFEKLVLFLKKWLDIISFLCNVLDGCSIYAN